MVDNIPGMDPELLVVISLPNLQRMRSKRKMTRVEDEYFIILKVCSTKPYSIVGLYLLIYIEHKGTKWLWSNGFTKAREKIEPWATIKIVI